MTSLLDVTVHSMSIFWDSQKQDRFCEQRGVMEKNTYNNFFIVWEN